MKKRIYLLLAIVIPAICMAVSFSDTRINYDGTTRYKGKAVIGKISTPDSTINYTWTDWQGDTSLHLGIRFPHAKDTAHMQRVPGVYFENYADGRALWYYDNTARCYRKAGLPVYTDTTAAPKVTNTVIISSTDSGRMYFYSSLFGKWKRVGT